MAQDFRLDHWVIRPERRLVERDGEAFQLRPKAMAVLECLAATNGEVVSRDQLFAAAWPGAEVSDDTLTQSIVELRKAFGETARNARVIETIPKKGFRLVPAPEPLTGAGSSGNTGLTSAVSIAPGNGNSKPRSWFAVSAAMAGLALLAGGLAWYANPGLDDRPILEIQETKTLAVLPFLDLSRDGSQAYFSSGLVEELQINLAQLRGLRVTGRVSTAYVTERQMGLAEIGKRLNVNHVLEGSVRESGQRLRVAAKLIEVEDGYQVWSDTYELDPQDLFTVQDQIAESVATALSITLSVGELGSINGGTRNLEAYRAFLDGWEVYLEGSPQAHLDSLVHFERATALDPDYGLAWERVAHIYMRLPFVFGQEGAGQWRAKSDRALVQAFRVAPDSPVVLATAAVVHVGRQDWREAAAMYLQAQALPTQGLAIPIVNFGNYLMSVGRVEEAIVLYEQARQIEPLWALIAQMLGTAYMNAQRWQDAEQEFQRGFDISPVRVGINGLATAMTSYIGDEEGNSKWDPRWRQHITAADETFAPFVAIVSEDANNIERQEAWLRKFYESSEPGMLDALAGIQAGIHGFPDLALQFSRRTPASDFLWMPWQSEMRKLPGFKDLVREIGLVDYWREFSWGDYCRPLDAKDDLECF